MSTLAVTLHEWETLQPDSHSPLRDYALADSSRTLIKRLKQQGSMEVLELARGLEIRTTSFIGRVRLGNLTITVQPKLRGAPLLNLLRYAYHLRDIDLYDPASYEGEKWAFQDLLIWQLTEEVRRVLARSMHREYERIEADLSNPRGRIEFRRLVSAGYSSRPVLPCTHYPRSEDTVLNQILLAGLIYAAALTTDIDLRVQVNHLVKLLSLSVSRKRLSSALLADGHQALDRRTTHYRSALLLIRMLFQAEGLSLEEEMNGLPLRGFLFDMNRFFQALISRFLHDNLQGYEVNDEHRIESLFYYDQDNNPRKRQAPVVRPDFVIHKNRQVKSILDAKYRDLWEKSLPREMLYQLAVYSLAQPTKQKKAVILYPTLRTNSSDQIIHLCQVASEATQAQIILRPVSMLQLEELLRIKSLDSKQRRSEFANQLSFGRGLS